MEKEEGGARIKASVTYTTVRMTMSGAPEHSGQCAWGFRIGRVDNVLGGSTIGRLSEAVRLTIVDVP